MYIPICIILSMYPMWFYVLLLFTLCLYSGYVREYQLYMRGSRTNIRSAFRPAFPLFDRRSDSRMSSENWQTATWQCMVLHAHWLWNPRPKQMGLSENIGHRKKWWWIIMFLVKSATKQGHTPNMALEQCTSMNPRSETSYVFFQFDWGMARNYWPNKMDEFVVVMAPLVVSSTYPGTERNQIPNLLWPKWNLWRHIPIWLHD